MLARRSVALATALTLMAAGLAAAPAAAQGYPSMRERTGPFVALRAFGGFTMLQDITQDGSIAAEPTNKDHTDATAGPALAGGYQFAVPGGGLQVELEYGFRWRYDYEDARPVLDGGPPVASNDGLSSDVQTHTGLVNFRYLFDFGGNLHPFVVAGLGLSQIKAESESTRLGAPGPGQLDDTTNQTNFTWTVGAGVEYDITRRLGLALSYRYMDMGEVDLGTFARPGEGSVNLKGDFVTHDILLGLLYRF